MPDKPTKSFFKDTGPLPQPKNPKGAVYGKSLISAWAMTIGAGNTVFNADISGIWLGAATFANAPFKVDMQGNMTATAVAISGYLPLAGGTMAGDLILAHAPTLDLEAANRKYVLDLVALYLPLSGGTLSNCLILAHAPTVDLEAATKKYVDDNYSKIVMFEDNVISNNDEIVYNL